MNAATRQQWLSDRRRILGGTDAAAVLGLHPNRGPWDVWASKTGLVSDDAAGEPAVWGSLLEPVIVGEFARRTGLEVQPGDGIVTHPSIPWLGGTPDGYAFGAGHPVCILEVKTISAWKRNDVGRDGDEAGDDTCPAHWRVQVWQYQYATDLRAEPAYLAALVGGQELRILRVPYDYDYERILLPRLRAFWQLVEDGTPPEVDGSDGCGATLRAMFPGVVDDLAVRPDLEEVVTAYKAAALACDDAEDRKRAAYQRILAAVGETRATLAGSWKVTRSVSTPSRIDVAKLRKERPDVAAEYTAESDAVVRLTVTPRKGGGV